MSEVEIITNKLLKKQIEILRKGDYTTNSTELEISKYVKDVLVKSLVTGDLSESKKKLLPQIVLSECPDIFQAEHMAHLRIKRHKIQESNVPKFGTV